jgi:hypothetical protein
MQYISIIFKHVDLFNTSHCGDVQFLECSLEFSIISLGSGLGFLDDFTSGCSFSAYLFQPNERASEIGYGPSGARLIVSSVARSMIHIHV